MTAFIYDECGMDSEDHERILHVIVNNDDKFLFLLLMNNPYEDIFWRLPVQEEEDSIWQKVEDYPSLEHKDSDRFEKADDPNDSEDSVSDKLLDMMSNVFVDTVDFGLAFDNFRYDRWGILYPKRELFHELFCKVLNYSKHSDS